MTWTREKCGTLHATADEIDACRKSQRRITMWALGLIVVLAVIVLGVDLTVNQWLYGDWTCAFAKCVRVVP